MDATQYLCDKCASIFEPGSYESWKTPEKTKTPLPRYLHESSESLRESTAKGCWLCKFVDQGCRDTNRPRDDPVQYTLKASDEPQFDFKLEFRADRSTSDAFLVGFSLEKQYDRSSLLKLAELSKIQSWTGDDAVLELVVSWLQLCKEEHGGFSERTSFRPTRFLDVSKETIRLVSSIDTLENVNYITLSHCWGPDAFFRLTSATLVELQSGVKLHDFPLSFQHAIRITRRLNVHYIWIDCYCIIQGSDDLAGNDWENESVKMGHVYGNSYLNIGAAHATGPHMGIFQDRQMELVRSMSFQWQPFNNSTPALYSITRSNSNETNAQLEDFLKCPINKRGWVLQESVLSPRMATFGRDRVFWQCKESKLTCEDFPYGVPEEEERAVRKLLPFWSMESEALGQKAMNDALALNWFHLVTSYCDTELSFPDKDKLRAIDGVGRKIGEYARDIYNNGMLKRLMPTALLWTCPKTSTKTSSERAPSWHWASVDGAVRYHNAETPVRLAQHRSYAVILLSAIVPRAAEEAMLSGGPGSRRYLICIGKLLKLNGIIRHPKKGINGAIHWSAMWDYQATLGSCNETIKIDMDQETELDGFVLFHRILPIQLTDYLPYSTFRQRDEAITSKGYFNFQGVVLAKTEHGCWRRVGTCSVDKEDARLFGDRVTDRGAFMTKMAENRPQCLLIQCSGDSRERPRL